MKEEVRNQKAIGRLRTQTKCRLLGVLRLGISSFFLLPSYLSVAFAQPEFKVTPGIEATIEGGNVNILIIQTDNEHFQLRVPKTYVAQVHQSDQSIVFTSQTGSSVITMTMSTNYAGGLPKKDVLRDAVANKYSTASLVQTSPCITSCGTGQLFDIFQPVAGDLTMRMRVGYVAFKEGSFEFILSCDNREYDQHRLSFAWLLNSFRLQAEPAIKNP